MLIVKWQLSTTILFPWISILISMFLLYLSIQSLVVGLCLVSLAFQGTDWLLSRFVVQPWVPSYELILKSNQKLVTWSLYFVSFEISCQIGSYYKKQCSQQFKNADKFSSLVNYFAWSGIFNVSSQSVWYLHILWTTHVVFSSIGS